ncbi:hypothetical protein BTJ49_02760 [Oleiagrimonas sp. MCCC 1A03011]|nr:hypothetical protein BTJ49_02760 [Oleiagrimonas sp. MCCC 1A03011]
MQWRAGLGLALLCLLVAASRAAPIQASTQTSVVNASIHALLEKAEQYSNGDHARFLPVLRRLQKLKPHLNKRQQQHVAYWEAWEAGNKGDVTRSILMLEQIADHTDDPSLDARAKLLLIHKYMASQKYVQAFTLANTLTKSLNTVADPDLHDRVLVQMIQMLVSQKQYDQALSYAKQLKSTATTDTRKCQGSYFVTNTQLQRLNVLTSSSPQFHETIDQCLAADMLSYANALRLNWASLMDDEGHTEQALAYLNRIAPDIIKTGYQAQIASLYVTRAQAYLIQRNYALASQWANKTLAANAPNNFNWTVQAAYEVLYKVQEHEGQYFAALSSYKKYIDQYKKSTSDAKAQALAYQIVQQEVLTKRLKLQELSKQNRILQLRQSLDRKSAETSRLYILLLLFVLASIGFWAYRTKHSQLRFRRMAREDDLTGTFNRQHFLDCASRLLQRMQKTDNEACLMILDMDHFKRVNDMYGHITGDVVLKHVTNICRHELRTSDVFGRLGGEEFGILMPGCTPQQGKEIGDRMRRALVNAPIQVLENESLTITASIGLASTRTSGYQLKRLLVHADEALYEAKRNGRNQLMISSGAANPETAAQPG